MKRTTQKKVIINTIRSIRNLLERTMESLKPQLNALQAFLEDELPSEEKLTPIEVAVVTELLSREIVPLAVTKKLGLRPSDVKAKASKALEKILEGYQ